MKGGQKEKAEKERTSVNVSGGGIIPGKPERVVEFLEGVVTEEKVEARGKREETAGREE